MSDNTNSAPETSVTNESGAEAQTVKAAKRPKNRLVKSITVRTMLNYCIFAAVVLIMLWAVLVFGLYGFYDIMLKDDIRKVGSVAEDAFPKRADDNSMMIFYRVRLSELARSNSVNVVVFTRDAERKVDIIMTVDAVGNSATVGEGKEIFENIIESIDIDKTLASPDKTDSVRTGYGTFVYHGSAHNVETEFGNKTLYMVVVKPYEIFNYQTHKFMYMLIFCTVTVLVLASICAYFASRYQTGALTDFTKKAKRMAAGDYDIEFSGRGYYEYDILANALNDATDRVKRTDKLQRDIVANVSHDIRTPITIIRAYAEMIRDMPLDDTKRKKTAETIIAEADKLTMLTGDILNYSKLQSGVAEFSFAPCDLSKLASVVLKRFDLLRERDGIVFEAQIEKDVKAVCDAERIEQVLYNLISNACNYCGDDKTVVIVIKHSGDNARVEVTDHGVGIAEDELDSVWDRYYRTSRAKRNAVGTGLGLSICNNILKAHNAEFGVTSKLGEGSTFWFELDTETNRKA